MLFLTMFFFCQFAAVAFVLFVLLLYYVCTINEAIPSGERNQSESTEVHLYMQHANVLTDIQFAWHYKLRADSGPEYKLTHTF